MGYLPYQLVQGFCPSTVGWLVLPSFTNFQNLDISFRRLRPPPGIDLGDEWSSKVLDGHHRCRSGLQGVPSHFSHKKTCRLVSCWNLHSLKLTVRPWKWWFPIGISFSRGVVSGTLLVSGAMLVSGRVKRTIATRRLRFTRKLWPLLSQKWINGSDPRYAVTALIGLMSDHVVWSRVFWSTAFGSPDHPGEPSMCGALGCVRKDPIPVRS